MSKRISLYSKGFSHKNPIPSASRIGNLLVSGVIIGRDPDTGDLPESLADQCTCMFRQIRLVMEAAGASLDDIIKVTVWMKDSSDRSALNREWLAMFPDAQTRPARQAMIMEMGGGMLIKCDIMAVL